jgi:hypothetical protein
MLPFSMLSPSIDGFRLYPEPRRARPTLPHPAFPVASTAVPSSLNLCALCVGVYPERLGALSSPIPYLLNFKLPVLSTLRNVGSAVEASTACPVYSEERREQSRMVNHVPNSFTIRTSAKRVRKPCRMRSFKTQDLKPFRMCSSEKNGVGKKTLQFLLFSAPPPRSLRLCVILIPSLPAVGCEVSTVSFLPHLFRGPNEVN